MWIDNASDVDMLFYKPYAELILKTVKNKSLNPLTIGLFGSWGAGKSTLLNIIEQGISEKEDNVICINLNAWMFEGYDDAKAALMESLLQQIKERQSKFGRIGSKLKSLLGRIKYFKLGSDVLSKSLPLLTSIITHNPLPLTLSLTSDLTNALQDVPKTIENLIELKGKYINDENNNKESIIQNIRLFKKEFSTLLASSKINNLVVIIDDLDRCTPERIIDTLEAIKLFLSVPKTTFILAVDERIIEYSVKRHYPLLDDKSYDISKDYIEKIIQLPITIPELSSKDIENYLLILMLQLYLKKDIFISVLENILESKYMLKERSITIEQFEKFFNIDDDVYNDGYSKEIFYDDFKIINSIKEIVSSNLKGNPRQAKRFLNTFIAKKSLSKMYFGDDIDIQIMTKLLALQVIDIESFRELNEWNKQFDGQIKQLKEISELISNNNHDFPPQLSRWNTSRLSKWISCEPKELYKENLSKYFYLSRDVLNKNNDLIDGLSTDEKTILQEIVNASDGTIGIYIDRLMKQSPDSLEKIIKVLLSKFDTGDLKNNTISRLFKSFPSYRSLILCSVEKVSKEKLNIRSVPYLKAIYKEDPDNVKIVYDRMKDNNMPKATYDEIITKE